MKRQASRALKHMHEKVLAAEKQREELQKKVLPQMKQLMHVHLKCEILMHRYHLQSRCTAMLSRTSNYGSCLQLHCCQPR